ncbi:hypothetical protein HYH03_007131 [Edaphochlamys debaryana]|uniref:Protein kinase domain-containing protein n=1 Tax=Edaphochlamys debaryana TaxID=47281 RepID=A0A836C0U5_9CHLO|nr:hypothetical protein HYH03_007131 [Edaphochlamys debaryana]|eukprot:KAG2494893.1 hypothetical protein HYH03_007131 [Edaphochlamys debaryana]
MAEREARALRMCDHPTIVKLLHALRGHGGRQHIVMEYVERSAASELDCQPRGLPAPQLKLIAWQLCLALRYLHGKGILHRDIKPANILLGEDGCAKLCDFGLARVLPSCPGQCNPEVGGALSSYVVTRWYRPPEVLLSLPYGPAADVFSLGCTLAELARGSPLFPGTSSLDQLWRPIRCLGPLSSHMASALPSSHLASNARAVDPGSIAAVEAAASAPRMGRPLHERLLGAPACEPQLLQLLGSCLNLDPAARLTADDLLRRPYFAEIPSLVSRASSLSRLYLNECRNEAMRASRAAATAAAATAAAATFAAAAASALPTTISVLSIRPSAPPPPPLAAGAVPSPPSGCCGSPCCDRPVRSAARPSAPRALDVSTLRAPGHMALQEATGRPGCACTTALREPALQAYAGPPAPCDYAAIDVRAMAHSFGGSCGPQRPHGGPAPSTTALASAAEAGDDGAAEASACCVPSSASSRAAEPGPCPAPEPAPGPGPGPNTVRGEWQSLPLELLPGHSQVAGTGPGDFGHLLILPEWAAAWAEEDLPPSLMLRALSSDAPTPRAASPQPPKAASALARWPEPSAAGEALARALAAGPPPAEAENTCGDEEAALSSGYQPAWAWEGPELEDQGDGAGQDGAAAGGPGDEPVWRRRANRRSSLVGFLLLAPPSDMQPAGTANLMPAGCGAVGAASWEGPDGGAGVAAEGSEMAGQGISAGAVPWHDSEAWELLRAAEDGACGTPELLSPPARRRRPSKLLSFLRMGPDASSCCV